MKEIREVRIVKNEGNYWVEVFQLELDDELSYYKNGMTLNEALIYIDNLKEKYNVVMVEW
jgi:hypothetical protein